MFSQPTSSQRGPSNMGGGSVLDYQYCGPEATLYSSQVQLKSSAWRTNCRVISLWWEHSFVLDVPNIRSSELLHPGVFGSRPGSALSAEGAWCLVCTVWNSKGCLFPWSLVTIQLSAMSLLLVWKFLRILDISLHLNIVNKTGVIASWCIVWWFGFCLVSQESEPGEKFSGLQTQLFRPEQTLHVIKCS